MPLFALSAVGRDRPGIVAAVSGALLEHEANIEDSRMAILRGHFAMTLMVAAPERVDAGRLGADLDAVRQRLDLEAVSLSEVAEAEHGPAPSHVVSVYGVDHPGIVHAVSSAMAERGWSITDLSTRLVGEDEDAPLYAMMLEVALPEGVAEEELARALDRVAGDQGVEVSARPLAPDAL